MDKYNYVLSLNIFKTVYIHTENGFHGTSMQNTLTFIKFTGFSVNLVRLYDKLDRLSYNFNLNFKFAYCHTVYSMVEICASQSELR